jgi:hypothetical protein
MGIITITGAPGIIATITGATASIGAITVTTGVIAGITAIAITGATADTTAIPDIAARVVPSGGTETCVNGDYARRGEASESPCSSAASR